MIPNERERQTDKGAERDPKRQRQTDKERGQRLK